jgi:hypothetical protein
MAREITLADAETYGQRFPPIATIRSETPRVVEGIAADPDFARGYADFRRDMVYGEALDFETAIVTLKALAGTIK